MISNFEQKISFIGGGNMAQAIIGGLLSRGMPSTLITVSEPVEKIQEVLKQQDLNVTDDNAVAIEDADVVILAVKPQVLSQVLTPLAGKLKQQLIISIVAGAPITLISSLLDGYDRIVRVMPNTPALVQCGANGAFASEGVNQQDQELASKILSATGLVIWVDQERKIDAITALSGSGPAYFFYLMEAMIQAGKNLGLDEKTATALTLQTALGAAQMAITSEHSPSQLRKNVTSPGGTTQAAIEIFDQFQVSQHIQAALAAAEKRSQELAQELALRIQTPSK
ncbi:pyrroline-5-carboxylate reductase [Acinetobacter qingfengensis]|uniref:Pyrroline-5-carboxylate reductase n=1 Tax=Acinetobacter qingfengensis TaxID=1262585 RepID=A0A1E7RF86_9GAMM|nr:pyrroline-5-carboxylate reductase [Acinetobacter qingfengensis]KAA8731914.1 pyrroline-5-carboxylate reductase [Acinetobacter qingfengensis]OEY97963.1 pyrroline-5-carboxylate reductase [Acinetobacter qingfengensis]